MWAMMLIGMGLFRLGVLQGARPMGSTHAWRLWLRDRFTPERAGVYGMIGSNFEPVADGFWNVPHHAGRLAVALAHAAVIVMVVKRGALRLADGQAGGRGSDRALELHRHVGHLRAPVLHARARADGTVAAIPAVRRRCRNLDSEPGVEPLVAAPISFRPAGVVLAIAHLLEAPAVARSIASRPCSTS